MKDAQLPIKLSKPSPQKDRITAGSPLEEALDKPRKLGLPRRKLDQVVNVNPNAIKEWVQHKGATPASPIAKRCGDWEKQGYQPKEWST